MDMLDTDDEEEKEPVAAEVCLREGEREGGRKERV